MRRRGDGSIAEVVALDAAKARLSRTVCRPVGNMVV